MTGTPHSNSRRAAEAAPTTVEVVRSEERLEIGRAVRVSGRAVLRKYVVTETVTQTFQVRHEEFRVDQEPADGTGLPDVGDHPFAERVIEVVLHREVPVVQMRVEATERVRLHVDTVTEHVSVSGDVRKERIDLDAPNAQQASAPGLQTPR